MFANSTCQWLDAYVYVRLYHSFLLSASLGDSDSKESACNTGNPGSITELKRSPGEGNGYPLQYSCLENSIDRGAWQTTVHGLTESQTQLSD